MSGAAGRAAAAAADAADGDDDDADESDSKRHVDSDVAPAAPPVGLRGLLQVHHPLSKHNRNPVTMRLPQRKDSVGSGSCALSNVGDIYGDIQTALLNFPKALKVRTLRL